MSSVPRPVRWLLRLLPEPFRSEHAEGIAELAATWARGRGPIGRARVWLGVGFDILEVALRARLSGRPDAAVRGLGRQSRPPRPAERLDAIARDIRYALRSLRGEPGFTAFAILVVGLGVGASVTVFSVARALLLEPLPFEEPERLVWISNGEFGRGQALSEISAQVGHVVNVRENATQLEDVAGYHLFDRAGDHTLVRNGQPLRVTRLRVTPNLFSVLGVEPAFGRTFTVEEASDDGPPAILLTWASWSRLFDRSGTIVGSTIDLDGVPVSIIGVLPESFDFETIFAPGSRVDYVAPFPLSARSHRSGNTLGLVGRLAGSATLASAQAEIGNFAVEEWSDGDNAFHPRIRPLREHLAGSYRATMTLLTAAVALVMLLVCANLSNLLLARATVREREFAVRAAMGAGRRRLVQQLLTESLLLSLAGSALGVVLAIQGTSALASLGLHIPMLADVGVDGAALSLAVIASVTVGLIFGVVPALRSASPGLGSVLREGGRTGTASRRMLSLRSGLVVVQVAIASVLLVGSTLTGRSLVQLLRTDLGYDPAQTVAIRVDPSARFEDEEARIAYYDEIVARAAAAPGVQAVGLSDMLPMAFNRRWSARDADQPEEESVSPFVRMITRGYLPAMGLTVTSGRGFDERDEADAPRVAIVNELLAGRLWGNADPIGRRLNSNDTEYTVVGVVRPTRQLSVDQEPGPELFFNLPQMRHGGSVHLLVRGSADPATLIADVRAQIRTIDATVPLDGVVRLRETIAASVAPRRFVVLLLSAFGVFALVLATLGIYAVISYTVAQRRFEIGIHMALGATSARVQSRLVVETLRLAGVGLVLGLVLSRLGGRAVEGLLYGVPAADPVSYLASALLIASAAAVAAFAPARRAARSSPLDAFRGADGLREG